MPGIILHGVCFDFFFVTGQIYVDQVVRRTQRASAQGFIHVVTYGVGQLIGSWAAGAVVDHYAYAQDAAMRHQWEANLDRAGGDGRGRGGALHAVLQGSAAAGPCRRRTALASAPDRAPAGPALIVRGTPAYRRMRFALSCRLLDFRPDVRRANRSCHCSRPSLASMRPLRVSRCPSPPGPWRLPSFRRPYCQIGSGAGPVMIFSLLASAALTLLSAVVPGWTELLLMRAAIGLALAGLPSVAMAYVSEEVHPNSVGAAMGLYVAASAIGGMAGRLGMAFMSQYAGWREAIGLMAHLAWGPALLRIFLCAVARLQSHAS